MEKQYTAMLFPHWFAVREKVSKGVIINSLDLSHNLKLKNLSITSTPNLKHLDVSMLTELNAGGMSINLFEYLTTFVGNGLVFPSGIWYEDPEKRIEVSECKKGQTIYSYHYKAETDGVKSDAQSTGESGNRIQCVEKNGCCFRNRGVMFVVG